MGERRIHGPSDHEKRLDEIRDEIDNWRRQFDDARAHAEDRRRRPDRRRMPRADVDRRHQR
jgi:hypothetical protein